MAAPPGWSDPNMQPARKAAEQDCAWKHGKQAHAQPDLATRCRRKLKSKEGPMAPVACCACGARACTSRKEQGTAKRP